MKKVCAFLMVMCLGASALAARARGSVSAAEGSTLTYDLGASAGSYGGKSYSELQLGLNWYVQDWMNWRNAVFTRFGEGKSAAGLDSSLRFEYNNQGDAFGMKAFAGPGYRFSSSDLSAAFAEAGLVFRVGGLSLGAGVKSMYYPNPGTDANGQTLSRTDNSYFIIVGGGGVL